MNKKASLFLTMIMLVICIAILPGCNRSSPTQVPANTEKVERVSSLTDAEIIALIQKADALPLAAFNKVESAETIEDSATGNVYLLFPTELDSPEKMKNYLAQAWAPEAIEQFLRFYKVVEGKLCHPTSNWSSIGQHDATDKIIKREQMGEDALKVIISAQGPDGFFEREYQLRKVKDSWLVSYSPELAEIQE